MGQMTTALYADFVFPSAVTAVSENASFPATNAAAVTSPNWPYKGSNAIATTERLVYDFGSATALAAIIIDHVNVGSVTVKGNATASWGSPSWTSGTLTVSKDAKDGRRKLYHVPTGTGSPFNYRYLALEPATTTTTDGSAVWRVGCLLALRTVTAWSQNHNFPYTPTQRQAIEPGIKVGGGGDPTALGNRHVEISIPTSRYDNAAMEAIFDDILAQRADPLVYYRNFSSTAEVYICHVVGSPSGPARRAPGLLEVGAITLRGVV